MFHSRAYYWWKFRSHPRTMKVLNWINYHLRAWKCECCHSFRGVEIECGRTAYHYEGAQDVLADPNRSVGLCRACAKMYHEHWDAMWEEYRTMQGY